MTIVPLSVLRGRGGPTPVGVDDRPGWIRLAIADVGCLEIHSISATPALSNGVSADYISDGVAYCLAGCDFRNSAADVFSASHRVLVHHALVEAGQGGRSLQVASTLPSAEYFSGKHGRENLALIEAKAHNLGTPVHSTSSCRTASLAANYVCAQGVSAWIDTAIGSDGRLRHNLTGAAAVVEIEARRTCCTTVLPGYVPDHGRCGFIDYGYGDLIALLEQSLRLHLDLHPVASVSVANAIKTGFLEHQGRVFEVRTLADMAQRQFVDHLLSEVVRRVGALDEFYRIILVGPGAALCQRVHGLCDNVEVPEDPRYAGARGLVKYLQYVV